MRFVQFYFGLPIAMVIISAVFVPIYYRLNVFTAYEYLEQRFDVRVRVLTALLFMIGRGLAAGISIYAPAIILSSVLGWSLNTMNALIGAGGHRLHRHRRGQGGQPDPEAADGRDHGRNPDSRPWSSPSGCRTASGSATPPPWPARWAG